MFPGPDLGYGIPQIITYAILAIVVASIVHAVRRRAIALAVVLMAVIVLVVAAIGVGVARLTDVGVAGIHRLLTKTEALQAASAVIVVAGMDGALPSVVGGLVRAPVIAVPTSVGYGASFGGLAALLTMLNSCAAGVVVCNIDNGFGAAMAAARAIGR